MQYSDRQIELAEQFKALGLAWEPAVGDYVYDATGAIKPSSPFQERVYFILNYDCFMSRLGGARRFKKLMTWLPTWNDARNILRSLGVADAEVQQRLLYTNAFADGLELLILYIMIAEELRRSRAEAGPEARLENNSRTFPALHRSRLGGSTLLHEHGAPGNSLPGEAPPCSACWEPRNIGSTETSSAGARGLIENVD